MNVHSPSESGLIVTHIRKLLRDTATATLATHDAESGYPYASLIAVATATDGKPLTLVSDLAVHTKNLNASPRASILFAAQYNNAEGDPLNFGRVSIIGNVEKTGEKLLRERFLARHPEARLYADFADFNLYRLTPVKAHYVGGFGRIASLEADQFVCNSEVSAVWEAAIGNIIESINKEKADLITSLAGRDASLAACDPDGCDVVIGQKSLRLNFHERLDSVQDIPQALLELSRSATVCPE